MSQANLRKKKSKFAQMTLKDIYRKYLNELNSIYSKGEAAEITTLIFESKGFFKSDVIKEPGQIVAGTVLNELNQSLEQLLNHKPVQYVTGTTSFCGLHFQVSESVLIPRPETAELVGAVLKFINKKNISILDIGTGSGCIAITLKKNNPNAVVTAIDISEAGLQIARQNAAEHHCDINFQKMDFLDEKCRATLKKFDVIVSNPPYIPEEEKDRLDKNVTAYEPHEALFVENANPVIFYDTIASFGTTHLEMNGRIFVETHEAFTQDVAHAFMRTGYKCVIKKDIFDKERWVIAEPGDK
jgi:release factor glutamine methyltransferase